MKLRKKKKFYFNKKRINCSLYKNAPSNFNAKQYFYENFTIKNNDPKITRVENKKKLKEILKIINTQEILKLNNIKIKKSLIKKTIGISSNVINSRIKSHNNKNSKNKITQSLIKNLKLFIDAKNNRFLPISDIKNKFESSEFNSTHACLSRSSYYRILKKKNYLNMSFKKVSVNKLYLDNSDNTKMKRFRFSRLLLYYKSLGYMIFYIDETGLSTNLQQEYGWCEKGKPLISKKEMKRCQNFSLLCAISEGDVYYYQVFWGGIRSADFANFITRMVNDNNLYQKRYIIVLDNCKIHCGRFYKKMENIFPFVFLPKYSPFLNPIETFFSSFKRSLKKESNKDPKDLFRNIHKVICNFDPNLIIKFVRYSYEFVLKCMNNEDIV